MTPEEREELEEALACLYDGERRLNDNGILIPIQYQNARTILEDVLR